MTASPLGTAPRSRGISQVCDTDQPACASRVGSLAKHLNTGDNAQLSHCNLYEIVDTTNATLSWKCLPSHLAVDNWVTASSRSLSASLISHRSQLAQLAQCTVFSNYDTSGSGDENKVIAKKVSGVAMVSSFIRITSIKLLGSSSQAMRKHWTPDEH